MSLDNLGREPLLLASGSPRRAEILRAVGWEFEAIPANIDETRYPAEDARTYALRLAGEKALSVAENAKPGKLVLGADTIVVLENEILGKPIDESDARHMLGRLAGNFHEVITAIALARSGDKDYLSDHESTRVRFATMTPHEIDSYVRTGEPLDKAGAYGAQGYAALFIDRIEGDYWNIIGLPVRLLYRLANRFRMKEREVAR